MAELLRLEKVCYRYEDKYIGLSGASAAFHTGERVAVLGNNGAGKSTFFLCCNGVLHPQEGCIFLKGQEITNAKKDLSLLRQTVGLVFQDPDSQIIAGTVEDEVSFGPVNLRLSADEVRSRVDLSLAKMNLVGYETRAPQYLSGGEKKRLSIADILAMQPEMILLDEPTASLDPENVAILEQTLEQLNRAGIALVVSTHDVDFAYRFATRSIVFSHGEIIADAGVEEVFSSENTLTAAGLKKPLIYAAAELLENRFPESVRQRRPKDIYELERYIAQL